MVLQRLRRVFQGKFSGLTLIVHMSSVLGQGGRPLVVDLQRSSFVYISKSNFDYWVTLQRRHIISNVIGFHVDKEKLNLMVFVSYLDCNWRLF